MAKAGRLTMEQTLLFTRPHPIYLVSRIGAAFLLAALAAWVHLLLGAVAMLAAAVYAAVIAAQWNNTTLRITDHRIVFKRGVVVTETTELLLSDVRVVQLSKDWGYCADIGIGSAGHGGVEIEFPEAPEPQRIRELLFQLRSTAMGRAAN